MNGKRFLVGAGIALVWAGGLATCIIVGQMTGKASAKLCWAATEKLLALV